MNCWQLHKSYGARAICETWIEESKNQMEFGQIKMDDFWGSSAISQCSILAYHTVRWMALCSGDKRYVAGSLQQYARSRLEWQADYGQVQTNSA